MTIFYQKVIHRTDLRSNQQTALYLFGDNLEESGLGGQAASMRGEPNAVGIPTKRRPAMSEDAFFTDGDFDEVKPVLDQIFKEIRHKDAAHNRTGYSVLVIPADGLGTGLAQLPQRAPRIYQYLLGKLAELKARA